MTTRAARRLARIICIALLIGLPTPTLARQACENVRSNAKDVTAIIVPLAASIAGTRVSARFKINVGGYTNPHNERLTSSFVIITDNGAPTFRFTQNALHSVTTTAVIEHLSTGEHILRYYLGETLIYFSVCAHIPENRMILKWLP